jgi:subtilase family serine protease
MSLRIVYTRSDFSCTSNAWFAFGGTSAPSPSFAGIMALIVQATGQKWGNANSLFYLLGEAQYGGAGGTGAASGMSAVFHAITSGNNGFPHFPGYAAHPTPSYNLVTGLGSVDAAGLLSAFESGFLTVTVSPAAAVSAGAAWNLDGGHGRRTG